MKGLLGLFLVIISFIDSTFLVFRNGYFLWYACTILIGIAGSFMMLHPGDKRVKNIEKEIDEGIEKLKATGEKIIPGYDDCEFTDNSFSHEVEDQNVSLPFNPYIMYYREMTTENVVQSLLIYNHKIGDRFEKFRQGFPHSADAMKFYVLNKNVTLYIDPFDRRRYFFDLVEP